MATMHVNKSVLAGTVSILSYFSCGLSPSERRLLLGAIVVWACVPVALRAAIEGVSPLKVKRALSCLSCSTTGVVAVAALWDTSISNWETEFHITPILKSTILSHMGFYMGDLLTLQKEQAVIPSLVGHHVATIFANALALMEGGPGGVFAGREKLNGAVLVYASVLEVTGMFWYPYWIIVQDERLRVACGRAVAVLGVAAAGSFLVVRLLYATPRMLFASLSIWVAGPPSLSLVAHGLMATSLALCFALLNVLNFHKLSRSVLRLFRPTKGGKRAA